MRVFLKTCLISAPIANAVKRNNIAVGPVSIESSWPSSVMLSPDPDPSSAGPTQSLLDTAASEPCELPPPCAVPARAHSKAKGTRNGRKMCPANVPENKGRDLAARFLVEKNVTFAVPEFSRGQHVSVCSAVLTSRWEAGVFRSICLRNILERSLRGMKRCDCRSRCNKKIFYHCGRKNKDKGLCDCPNLVNLLVHLN